MKYIIHIILLLLVACAPTQEITIGVSLPLTGNLAFIGQSGLNAMDLAIEEVNEKYPYTFSIIYEDDGFQPTQGITNTQKLIWIDSVDVMVSYGSPTGVVIGPIAEEKNIPHIGIASANLGAIGKYNFNHWTPPKAQAEKLVDYMNKLNIKKISAITLNHEGGIALRDAVFNELDDIEVLREEKFTPGTTDFKTIWNKIKEDNPEMVFFVAQSPEFEHLLKQRRELGIEIPLATIESPDYTDQQELYNNNWFINAAEPTEEFVNKFETRYGTKPRVFSGNAYDIIHVIADAYAKYDGKATPEQVVEYLQNLEYKGAMGPFKTDSDGTFVTDAIVKEIREGKSITIT
ncbi:MAG: ABC transporter substrate-binding protein [Candidatus Nanoarchaeia archaeon]